ncbi:uncharacterized protein TRIADDRAFT_28855 [Trichoplax adhaerens]|uniref:GST N-terminal domain-containing protein n=1 Tax=Trichoplax adhaerens TaxID=10228 RepID=B3S4C5_TRIAD|nr:hypothetical protein TRIADDRAFT_28855 [Trichoplax adhaerens]EDV22615.1 hypothetical protein TRIADDRAFT_28855 [Trichoplax adhaerens]|eukprot:XP_002115159.1 hypothetical protein TRIADDRAFT_28855 [Trichoplax adhaerens]
MSPLAKPGLVVLHGDGPCPVIVNPSPFVLKLQTFLRMANIEFVHDLRHPFGRENKMPWIELDGKSYCDSTFIMEFLTERFNVQIDDHLDAEQKALARFILKTVEENTIWAVIVYNRFIEDFEWFGKCVPLPWFKYYVFKLMIIPYVKKCMYGHGMGRHSPEEIRHIARGDLMALSITLGNKQFFLGNDPTTIDACVFGFIVNILSGLSEDSWPNKMVREEFSNLVAFSDRMKARFWPDWDEITASCKSH